jgi:SAM-dependent methyltransferase
MSEMPNAAQAQRWNGESGLHWVANRERHEAGHRRLVPHLFRAAGIVAGDRVLDVGCGCGETTIMAARLAGGPPVADPPADDPPADDPPAGPAVPGSEGSAAGLDLSDTMLDMARRLAAEAGLANISFERGDAQVHPLPRDFYDVAMSAFGVMFFSDPAAAFANIAAAVRPGGRLAFLCWQGDLRNELFAIPVRAFQAGAKLAGENDHLFADPHRVTDLLSAAGWSNIQIDAVSEPAWMGSDAADVMAYISGLRKVRMLMAEVSDQRRADVALAAMAQEYRARQQPDGVWVSAAAWVVRARRG